MTVPPANPPRPGGIIASWSGTAYSTRQVWLISQLTSISEGLSPIRHPGTRLVGDGRPTTELEVAYSRIPEITKAKQFQRLQRQNKCRDYKGKTVPEITKAKQLPKRQTLDVLQECI